MKVLCSTQNGFATTVLGQTIRASALGRALFARGHDVAFIADPSILPAIDGRGFRVLLGPPLPPRPFPVGAFFGPDDSELEKIAPWMREAAERTLAIERAMIATERPDVVIAGNMTAAIAANDAGLPSVLVALQPHGPGTFAMLADRAGRLPEVRERFFRSIDAVSAVFLEGTPEIGPEGWPPDPWRKKVFFTGPLLPEPPDDLPSQSALKARHAGDAKAPLVYVTIGGGSPLIGEEFLALALDAMAVLPRARAVIATGLAMTREQLPPAPSNAIIRGFVPGTELVKASDVVLFHGGSSTLMTCIACGRPGVVVPSMMEQEENAEMLVEQGAGIALDKASLTVEKLQGALHAVLAGAHYRVAAERLKMLGDRYGGSAAAAELIEGLGSARGAA